MPERVREAALAWESLLRAQGHLMKTFEAAGDFAPLSPREYDVLFVLDRAGGAAPMKQLVEGALLTQPSMSRMVDRLEARGILERRPSPADRRAVIIALTDHGADLQRQIGRRHVRTIAQHLSSLSGEELAALTHICTKLREGTS